jgi:hypothetical protein
MIVDSFGHYLAQTVHDHGPPAARHKYPVALCLSMHKHAQGRRSLFGNTGHISGG